MNRKRFIKKLMGRGIQRNDTKMYIDSVQRLLCSYGDYLEAADFIIPGGRGLPVVDAAMKYSALVQAGIEKNYRKFNKACKLQSSKKIK